MPNWSVVGILPSLRSIRTGNIFFDDLRKGLAFKLVSKCFHSFFNSSMSGGFMSFCNSKFKVVLTVKLECAGKHQSPFFVLILCVQESVLDYCVRWYW